MAVRLGAMATAAAAWLVMAAPPAAAQASEDFWGTARMWSDIEVWGGRQKPRMYDVVGSFPRCSSTVTTEAGFRVKTHQVMGAGVVIDQNVEVKALQLGQDSVKIRIQRGRSLTFQGGAFEGTPPPVATSTVSLACEAQTTTTSTTTSTSSSTLSTTSTTPDPALLSSTDASSSGDKSDTVGPVLITLAVVLLIVLLVSVFGVIYVVRSRAANTAAATKSTVSFENPMYDAAQHTGEVGAAPRGAGYSWVAPETASGQVAQNSTSGYMDVAPNANDNGYMAPGSPEYKENPTYIELEAAEGDTSGGYMDVAPQDEDGDFAEDV